MKINLSKQYNEKLGKKLRMKVTSAFFNCTKIKWGISIEARVSKFFSFDELQFSQKSSK